MITASTRLSDLLFTNLQLINVIGCFGIKLGIAEKSVKEVCKEHNIDLKFFISIINTYSSETYFPEVNEIDVNLLIDYLKKTHSYYLDFTIPRINKLFKSLQSSLPKDKSVKHIIKYFNDYKNELKKHIEFEESYLFPFIKDLMSDPSKQNKIAKSAFKRLKLEHSNVEDKLLDLKTILVRYLPESADEQLVFDLLFAIVWFEKNHENHAKFEDNILIPKLKNIFLKAKTD